MSEPLVSVFSLVYDTKAEYIIEFIKSLRNSTYRNYEYILIDDCSPNKANFEIIKDWIKENKFECKIIEHKSNMGICASINHALQLSRGKYIFGCSDDLIEPDKIKIQVETLENASDDVAVVYSDAYLIDSFGNKLAINFIERARIFSQIPSGTIFDDLLDGNFIPAMSALIKKSIFNDIGIYDENLKYEDYDIWLRISKKHKIIYSNYISCSYRLHSLSYSNTSSEWEKDNIKIYAKHLDNQKAREKFLSLLIKLYLTNERNISQWAKLYIKNFGYTKKELFFIKYNLPVKTYTICVKILKRINRFYSRLKSI